MRKRITSRTSKTCTLVQTDISTAFNKWNEMIKLKVNKKRKPYITSSIVIELGDSDPESTKNSDEEVTIRREYKVSFGCNDEVPKIHENSPCSSFNNSKRNLPVEFSEDEDDQLNVDSGIQESSKDPSTQPTQQELMHMTVNKPKECTHPMASTPTKMQHDSSNRPVAFSEDEDDQLNVDSGIQELSKDPSTQPAQQRLTHMTVNKPKRCTHPMASSTPTKMQHDSSNAHTDIGDISMILNENNNTTTESSANTSSENTEIYQPDSPKKAKIIVKEHVILQRQRNTTNTNICDDTTIPLPGRCEPELNTNVNPAKKRTAEYEKNSKKTKVDSSDNKTSDVRDKKLTKDKEDSNSTLQNEKNNMSNSPKVSEQNNNVSSKEKVKNDQTVQNNSIKQTPKNGLTTNQSEAVKNVSEQNNKISSKEKVKNDQTVQNNPIKQTPKNGLTTNQSEAGKNVNKQSKSSSSEKVSPVSDKDQSKKKDKIDANLPLCSKSSPYASLKSKIEGKKINKKLLELITDLFKTVYKTQHIKNLIVSDKEKIQRFFKMDVNYQYVCLKLFTWKRKWYNIFNFCNLINLNIDDSDVCNMYKIFKENNIIDTNYLKEDVIKLLNLLSTQDLKSICATFKSKPGTERKEDMINSLLRCCRTQSTLTNLKSTEDLIKEQIEQKLGRCMKLNADFHDTFYRTYLLGTFTNPAFTNMQDYFTNMQHLNVLFPKYAVQDYLIFLNKEEFIRYARARKCREELERLAGNDLESLKIANTVFTELKALKNVEKYDDDRFKEVPHLVQFTARAVYVSTLSDGVKRLMTKYPKDAKSWLEYLINYESRSTHRIGEWYYHLTWLHMRYITPLNYERAAQLLITVLTKHRHYLSEVQLHQLCKRGRLLKVTRKYKISQFYHDRIAELVPRQIRPEELPHTTIDACTIRENESGRKRDYVVRDMEGNTNILKVEQIALQYYLRNGYTGGMHCEGALIKTTFALFFWDIIYMDLPGCFLSNIQSVPLDMYTKYFYLKRKHEIDSRLKDIESGWSHSELVKWLTNMYDQHSHETGICEPGAYIENRSFLEVLVDCIGRQVLAKIYKRLVTDYRYTRSGMPDLLVWNADMKKSKFVEVKGEKDELSIGQSLWIKYLKDIGADVVVCHVHSIGSKRRIIKKKEENLKS